MAVSNVAATGCSDRLDPGARSIAVAGRERGERRFREKPASRVDLRLAMVDLSYRLAVVRRPLVLLAPAGAAFDQCCCRSLRVADVSLSTIPNRRATSTAISLHSS